MIVGTVFTLFVVPVFYSLIAADHSAAKETEFEQEMIAIGEPALGAA
jgi:hypothetical protein